MREILPVLSGWYAAHAPFGLATVVAVSRSAPRDPGAAMAVGPDDEVVGSVSGGCVGGAVFDLGVSYEYLGQKAGQQACEILLHRKKPGDLPFTTIKQPTVTVNPGSAAKFGVQIPSDVLNTAEKVAASD